MAKKGENRTENDDKEFAEYQNDKYSQVSENVKKGLMEADKERGPKAPGVTD